VSDALGLKHSAWSVGSICAMKRNTHVFIPQQDFKYLSGEDNLGCYQVCCACCAHM